ncbi:MAG TPA: hypothetical protein DEG13_12165 [Candidatus Microthrix parvicella]|jgi:hypothetical protein|nr:hypothetical protein [Candidatus Microthrix parvicella]
MSGVTTNVRGWGSPRRWALSLTLISTVAVAVRVGYVVWVLGPVQSGLDAIWYQLQGGSILAGTGFVVPTSLFEGNLTSTAAFPPAYPAYQAVWQWAVGPGAMSVRVAGVVPGVITVVLVALLGRALADARVGLLAAAAVALSPTLIAADSSTMSENLTVPLVLAALVLAHRVLTQGVGWPSVIALGAVCGVAVLTRQDLALMVVLVALPAVLASVGTGLRTRLLATSLLVLVVASVVGPWMWRNHRKVGTYAVSTISPSSALAGSNCDATYGGPDLGSWSFPCVVDATPTGGEAEVEVADAQRAQAVEYVRRHLTDVPLVLGAREARVWGLWDPRDLARRDADETRRYGWQLASRPLDAVLAVAGVVGLAQLGRRRSWGWEWLVVSAPLVIVCVSAAASYGNPRFNVTALPVLSIGMASLLMSMIDARRPAAVDREVLVVHRAGPDPAPLPPGL